MSKSKIYTANGQKYGKGRLEKKPKMCQASQDTQRHLLGETIEADSKTRDCILMYERLEITIGDCCHPLSERGCRNNPWHKGFCLSSETGAQSRRRSDCCHRCSQVPRHEDRRVTSQASACIDFNARLGAVVSLMRVRWVRLNTIFQVKLDCFCLTRPRTCTSDARLNVREIAFQGAGARPRLLVCVCSHQALLCHVLLVRFNSVRLNYISPRANKRNW
mmetsp:Transcript_86752/g.135821  ORF Transcript_86752/g.135821 Transcript_86752/m.135821 type:complete len:219 (-) Transcript_86752:124-780(-)